MPKNAPSGSSPSSNIRFRSAIALLDLGIKGVVERHSFGGKKLVLPGPVGLLARVPDAPTFHLQREEIDALYGLVV
jgi:hypothetical protein